MDIVAPCSPYRLPLKGYEGRFPEGLTFSRRTPSVERCRDSFKCFTIQLVHRTHPTLLRRTRTIPRSSIDRYQHSLPVRLAFVSFLALLVSLGALTCLQVVPRVCFCKPAPFNYMADWEMLRVLYLSRCRYLFFLIGPGAYSFDAKRYGRKVFHLRSRD